MTNNALRQYSRFPRTRASNDAANPHKTTPHSFSGSRPSLKRSHEGMPSAVASPNVQKVRFLHPICGIQLVRSTHIEFPPPDRNLSFSRAQISTPPSPHHPHHPLDASPTPTPAPTSTTSRLLQSWFPWNNVAQPPTVPYSSTTSTEDGDIAALGDGMVGLLHPTPKSNAGWASILTGYRSDQEQQQKERPSNNNNNKNARTTKAPLPPRPPHSPIQVDHHTLQLLRERVISGSKPGARLDNFKLGLVVEGGGMRGCVSGGSLQALNQLGVREAFDAVYGSSAGALNASFFLANQLDAVNIYHRHIASEQFINLRRLWSRRADHPPALNLDFLLDHVMQNLHPLDFESVISSPIPLNVVASSLDTLSPVLLNNFEDRHDLVTSLRASATVPEVAGGPVHHRGHRLVDAAVFEAVPFRSAIADGCTHVLVLCTRPAPNRRKSLLDQALSETIETAIKRIVMSPDYMVPAWKAEMETLVKDGLSQDDMLLRSLDDDAEQMPWFAGSHVFPIYPAANCPSPVSLDVDALKGGVAEGRRAAMTVMQAVLGDVLDFSSYLHEFPTSQIVPIVRKHSYGNSSAGNLWVAGSSASSTGEGGEQRQAATS